MMKKKLVVILSLLMLMSLLAVPAFAAEAAAPTVVLDGTTLSFDVPPAIDNGRTMVPLRAIFEKMGAKVDWDAATMTATAVKGSTTVVLKIGSLEPTINGTVKAIDVAGKIVDGRTLAPMRFVCEAFGGKVDWAADTQTATIKSAAPVVTPPVVTPPVVKPPVVTPPVVTPPVVTPPAATEPATAADLVKAVVAKFAPVKADMSFTGFVKGSPVGDLVPKITGSATIDASKKASATFTADLGALGKPNPTIATCPFSEIIAGPEADGLAIVANAKLTTEGNNYVLTLTGIDCPKSLLGIYDNCSSMVKWQLKMDCQVKVDKTSMKVVAVDNIKATGTATAMGTAYPGSVDGSISYK